MFAGAVFSLALGVTVSVAPGAQFSAGDDAIGMRLSPKQKNVAMRPLVQGATDCIVRAVAADPRLHTTAAANDVSELIVTAMSTCLETVRAMVDAHDRLFGEGSGEAFFMGPYLDVLPAAVTKRVQGSAGQQAEQKMAP
jgi:hypothetical protein